MSGSATNGVADRVRGRLRRIVAPDKPTAAVLACSAGFLFMNLVLALGQWDGGRVTFPAESGLDVSLEPGEQRLIYMTADEGSPWNFDFYPSDFDCSARGPDGLVAVRRVDHRRLLDGWGSYWSVGSLVADDGGGYRISCSGHRDAPLVLAAPARFTAGWASPKLGVVVMAVVLLGAALIHSVAGVVSRFRGGRLHGSV